MRRLAALFERVSRRTLLASAAVIVAVTIALVVVPPAAADLQTPASREAALRAAIRATARLSSVAVALAFARIRTRDLVAAFLVSHTAHLALIIALAVQTTPQNAGLEPAAAILGGALSLAILIAVIVPRPHALTTLLYIAWIVFVVSFVAQARNALIYPLLLVMLAASVVARWRTRPRFIHAT